MNADRARVAIIDDEPIIAERLASELAGLTHLVDEVYTLDRPRRLVERGLVGTVTHAIVDLSFGRHDIDAPDLRDEPESGVDAIDLLLEGSAAPASVVVLTRLDSELLVEMAHAIRQTWPTIRFVHKWNVAVSDVVEQFLLGELDSDTFEVAVQVRGVEPVPAARIVEIVGALRQGRTPARALIAVGSFAAQPSVADLAYRLELAPGTVRRLLNELGDHFKHGGLLRYDEAGGIGRLWRWARARRAILVRLFPDAVAALDVDGTATSGR